MKVLIADKLSQTTVDDLTSLGLQVTMQPDLAADDLPQAAAGANILVVRSTKVNEQVIAAARELSLIVRAGAGVNTIDLDAASRRGIYVANCPGRNTAAVAELAIGLLIAADRRISDATQSLRDGRWRKKEFGAAAGLKDRTLGILGFGAIGQAVAARATALEMNVLVWSRSLTPELAHEADIDFAASPLELAREADAVSVHLAATPETRHLVNGEFFAALKAGALFVNTSRGELVDTVALKTAIQQQQLRVGLDVFENEPAGGEAEFSDSDLASLITCTPHIGASTAQASEAIAAEVVRIVRLFLQTGHPPGAVNLCQRSPATHHLVVRHFNRVGVLAGVMDGLREEGVNVEEMDNVIFAGAAAACCTLRLDAKPSDALLENLRRDESILHVQLGEG